MNWQGIETAPTDGTRILGYADGDYAAVYWTGDYWNLCVCGAYAEDGEWTPTHWQPLPDEPNAESEAPSE